jgi:DNA-binding NtrC family response regulator
MDILFKTPPDEIQLGKDWGSARSAAPAPARPSAFSTPRGSILIVDDDEAVRGTLADLLEVVGFCPVQAADAPEALMILNTDPAVKAMVTDLSMPGTDGITLIGQARELRQGLPAILLTGYADQVHAVGTGTGGDFCVLRKPIEGDHLAEQLERLIGACPKLS